MYVEGSRGKVSIEREFTDTFEVKTLVRHWDSMSPLFFNLALEEALKVTKSVHRGQTLIGKSIF